MIFITVRDSTREVTINLDHVSHIILSNESPGGFCRVYVNNPVNGFASAVHSHVEFSGKNARNVHDFILSKIKEYHNHYEYKSGQPETQLV